MNKKEKKVIILTLILAIITLCSVIITSTIKTTNKLSKITDPETLRALSYGKITDNDTYVEGCKNLEFSAFFTRDLDGDGNAEKMKGTSKYINGSDKLYIDLNVLAGGRLENGEITINSNMLDNAIKTQEILEAKVTECDENYNLLLDFGENKKGIINRNEIELIGKNDKTNISTSKVNKYVQFKVKGIDESNNYILSRKDVEQDAITWLKNDVKEGNVLKGIVKSIQPYGAFVEIGGGVVGLVHIEDMSVARIKSPKERLHIGQKINIMVKSIDKEHGKIILTYKELLGTWEENIQDIKVGTTIVGKAREVEKSKNGIFIELKPNLVGLAEYKDGIEYGQNVNVYVKKIIPEKKKIKLIIV